MNHDLFRTVWRVGLTMAAAAIGAGCAGAPKARRAEPAGGSLPLQLAIAGDPADPYRGRRSAKRGALAAEEDEAVAAAVKWLAAAQQSDGSFGPGRSVLATAAALWALLGETAELKSNPHAAAVRRAAEFLARAQDEAGLISGSRQRVDPEAHALATWVLAEYCLRGGDEAIRPVLEKAARAILDKQQPGGGWYHDYQTFDRHHVYARRHTLTAAWQLHALIAAGRAGVETPGLADGIGHGVRDLLSVQNLATGKFGAESRGVGPLGNTAAALTVLQALGQGKSAPALAGLRALDEALYPTQAGNKWTLGESFFTLWAVYNQGGGLYQDWRPRMVAELLAYRRPDGSWPLPPLDKRGGPVYATALCAIMVQTPVRARPAEAWFPAAAGPPMWQARKGARRMYLLGAIPVEAEDVFRLDGRVHEALAAADVLLLTTREPRWFQYEASHLFYADEDKALGDYLSAKGASELKPFFESALFKEVERDYWRPVGLLAGALAVFLQNQAPPVSATGLGEYFARRVPPDIPAADLLEAGDVEELLAGLAPAEEEALLLAAYRERDRWAGHWSRTQAAWRAGEVEALAGVMNELRTRHPDAAATLDGVLASVTARMIKRVEAAVKSARVSFLVTDVWLLLGPHGLLAALEREGYAVERAAAAP
jgi:uncharacterized protein YbaP (TraB family)